MGLRGLTTYILNNNALFFDNYEFAHNTSIVIDGYATAASIYIMQWQYMNSCFGGNYDVYAEAVRKFFQRFIECKVTPYVLIDGATEERKFETVLRRLGDKIHRTITLKCNESNSDDCFPLLTIQVFRSIVAKMNIPIVVCDFECDREVANIAKELNCPVLSNDSDFYIFEIQFVPFFVEIDRNAENLSVVKKLEKNAITNKKELNMYLRCKLFNRKKFVLLTKLTENILPMMAVYLGNDYIHRVNDVQMFYEYLNIKLGRHRDFVEHMITWLKGKSLPETIEVMLEYYVEEEREMLRELIIETIEGYEIKKSKYMIYLEYHKSPQIIDDDFSGYLNGVSQELVVNYRKGFYHQGLLNFVLFNRYFPMPQFEEINECNSHTNSFQIISAIHSILTNDPTKDLVFYGRVGTEVLEQVLPKPQKYVPNYKQIQTLNLETRMKIFTDFLDIGQDFCNNCLKLFPDSWKVLMITLKYMSLTPTKVQSSFVYSLLLCKIILSHVDQKIGLIRSWDALKKWEDDGVPNRRNELIVFRNVAHTIDNINEKDSYQAMRVLLPYFQLSEKLQNDDTLFDRSMVHCMSVFQSCLLHIDMLNDIFNKPYENCDVYKCYNGMFIYNIFEELKKDKVNFLVDLLSDSPTLLDCFEYVVKLVDSYLELS